jgi:actin-like ATPase involved in cell morphogenesis
MLKRLLKLFSSDVAIDLGTANTAIYVAKRGRCVTAAYRRCN